MTVLEPAPGDTVGWIQTQRPGPATAARTLQRAKSLHREGRLREAERQYRSVLATNAFDFDSLHNLGLLCAQEGRLDEAVDLLRAGARQDPYAVEVHNNLASALAILRRHDEAVAGFRVALALRPDFAEAHNNLGKALAEQGRADEALEQYAKALALRPDYTEAHFNLGTLLHERGRLDEAAVHLRQAVAVAPNFAAAHRRLGDVHRLQGRLAEARASYERAVALKPGLAEAWLGLGTVLEQMQRENEALAAYAKAPNLAEAWMGRGRLLKRQQRAGEAVAAYRHALAAGGDAEIIGFFLASLGAAPAPAEAPARLIGPAYDQYSGRYDQHMVGTLMYRIPQLLAAAIAPFVTFGQFDVLDLGCGTGLLGAELRPFARTLAGVDISEEMISLARRRRIYDSLVRGNLAEVLESQSGAFDLVAAADVFVYFGDLSAVFRRVRTALRGPGLFAFSVEASEAADFELRSTQRYAHAMPYLRRLADANGFVVETIEPGTLRHEAGNPVPGYLAVLRRD